MRERGDGGCGWPRCRRPEEDVWALVERNDRRVPMCEEHLERWFESRGAEREKLSHLLFNGVECRDDSVEACININNQEDDMAIKNESRRKLTGQFPGMIAIGRDPEIPGALMFYICDVEGGVEVSGANDYRVASDFIGDIPKKYGVTIQLLRSMVNELRGGGKTAKKKGTKKSGGTKAAAGEYGRKGSLSELYKRLIMTTKASNAAIYAMVIKQVGEKKAGKPTYAGRH